ERTNDVHDEDRNERGGADTAEEKRGAFNLALAATEKIAGGDGGGSTKKRTERSQQCREYRREGEVGLEDERQDGAEARTTGNAKDVGISERIAKERLEAGAGQGERRTDNDSEDNREEADDQDDQEE